MRVVALMIAALAISGCARQSSGFAFHDVVLATSKGLSEYESWVRSDDELAGGNFPDALCLAGVHFTAAVAETKSKSAGVGIPLAAPASGLTGMLGYEFISTESEAGNLSATLIANYPERGDVKDGVEKRDSFVRDISERRKQWKVDQLTTGVIQPPLSMTDSSEIAAFESRDDLAAELWRIRQALHNAFLNSPDGRDGVTGERTGYLLVPGPMSFALGYNMSGGRGVAAKLSLAGRASGNLGIGSGISKSNRMVLVYLANQSEDPMNCDKTSFGPMQTADQRKKFSDVFNNAVTKALGGQPKEPAAVTPKLP